MCCDCCRGVVLWEFSCSICWGGRSCSRGVYLSGSGGRGVCLCGSVCWGGRRDSHGVCLGEGDGCGVCMYGSGGHGVCWGSSGGFCHYAGRDVVCWGDVGSGGDSNIVSNTGIVGISCVCSLGGGDISNGGCVSGSICSVSSGSKSYVSCVIVVVFSFFNGFYNKL